MKDNRKKGRFLLTLRSYNSIMDKGFIYQKEIYDV